MSMPEFKEVQHFPSPSDDLKKLTLFKWERLLFTLLKDDLDASVFLNDMLERLHWLPLEEFIFRPELSKDYYVKAHWALYCENYLEGFHIPFVHAGLNTVIDYSEYKTELFGYSSLQLGIAKGEEDCFDLPPSSKDHGNKKAAYYFWVFPNMMFNFYPWGLSVNLVQPIAIDKTKVSFFTYIWKKEKHNRGAGSDLDKVEMEDEEIVQSVQKGIRSRFYQHGRYLLPVSKAHIIFTGLFQNLCNNMSAPQLQRKLGLWACVSMVIGSVIGSSIFMKPATMAAQLGSPLLLLVVWVVAGIISIFGGMINAEIGAMIPETGGQYTYFRYMYGNSLLIFLAGLHSLLSIAAIASIAFIFAQYTSFFINLPSFSESIERSFILTIPFIGKLFFLQNFGIKVVAILLIVVITFINYISLKAGSAIQVFFTALKIAALAFLIFSIFFSGKGSFNNFSIVSSDIDFSSISVLLVLLRLHLVP